MVIGAHLVVVAQRKLDVLAAGKTLTLKRPHTHGYQGAGWVTKRRERNRRRKWKSGNRTWSICFWTAAFCMSRCSSFFLSTASAWALNERSWPPSRRSCRLAFSPVAESRPHVTCSRLTSLNSTVPLPMVADDAESSIAANKSASNRNGGKLTWRTRGCAQQGIGKSNGFSRGSEDSGSPATWVWSSSGRSRREREREGEEP